MGNRNMGYVDGKTDLDLILDEDKTSEEEELLATSQVRTIIIEV